VPRHQVEEIEQVVLKLYPGAQYKGTEPTIPAFP
jgi:hypothetical protein